MDENLTAEEMKRRKSAGYCPHCNKDMSADTVHTFSTGRTYTIFTTTGLCEVCQNILLKGEDEE